MGDTVSLAIIGPGSTVAVTLTVVLPPVLAMTTDPLYAPMGDCVRSRLTVRTWVVPGASVPDPGLTVSPVPVAVAVKSTGTGPLLPTVIDVVFEATPSLSVFEPPVVLTTNLPTLATVVVVATVPTTVSGARVEVGATVAA